jgi:DNA repair photolyase
VGFSLATLDEKIKQDFEYRSPPVKNRIDALKRLHREGIRTWVFIAPVLPFLTGLSLPALLEEIRDSVDYVMVDSLNIKGGNWPGISEILKRKYPSLLSSWKAICLTRTEKRNYYEKFQHRLVDLSRKNHICLQLC